MNFLDKFRMHPVILALRARDAFNAAAVVPLEHWFDLDRATAWCELRWRKDGRQYRRRIYAAEEKARFEFPSETDAFAFRLASRGRFREPRPRVR